MKNKRNEEKNKNKTQPYGNAWDMEKECIEQETKSNKISNQDKAKKDKTTPKSKNKYGNSLREKE